MSTHYYGSSTKLILRPHIAVQNTSFSHCFTVLHSFNPPTKQMDYYCILSSLLPGAPLLFFSNSFLNTFDSLLCMVDRNIPNLLMIHCLCNLQLNLFLFHDFSFNLSLDYKLRFYLYASSRHLKYSSQIRQ